GGCSGRSGTAERLPGHGTRHTSQHGERDPPLSQPRLRADRRLLRNTRCRHHLLREAARRLRWSAEAVMPVGHGVLLAVVVILDHIWSSWSHGSGAPMQPSTDDDQSWTVASAKAKLSEVIDRAQSAPQTITRNGRPSAVIVSV